MPELSTDVEVRWVMVGGPLWKHGYYDGDKETGFPWYVDPGMISNPVGGQGGHTLNDWQSDLERGGWKFGPCWNFATYAIQWVYRELAG